ncbi:hypothetical protein B9Z55_012352 [Caenorhabditis nigoni]|uniref:K Homology domain-containing protein n=1 Tax=Caenorhabditis nigoni TaxID=1611254 RepID=A0A2G5TWT7_9PELO|nr:hypothetical protein B9Z55_012352 [Caenorhabditis nigoni]
METGVSVVKALLIKPPDGQDQLKRQQLTVLVNLDSTYRPRTATATCSHIAIVCQSKEPQQLWRSWLHQIRLLQSNICNLERSNHQRIRIIRETERFREKSRRRAQCDAHAHVDVDVFTLIDKEIKRIGGGGDRHEAAIPGAPATLSEIIMGPRGTTAKQLESSTGCRVTILGRNKKDKDGNTSSVDVSAPVDNSPLRVEVSVPADAPDAVRRMETGFSVVKALLVPPADDQDQLERQLVNISSYGTHDSAAKQDCYNPKCAILRGLIEQNHHQQSGPIPKAEDVLSVMHMYLRVDESPTPRSLETNPKPKRSEINAYIESLEEEESEQLSHCSDGFNHVFTLIDKEIKRIGGGGDRHEAVVPGAPATLSEIIMVPVEQYPTYNFVGRYLGPRGTTAKQL